MCVLTGRFPTSLAALLMDPAVPNIFHLRKYLFLFFNNISSDCIIPRLQYILFLDHTLFPFWRIVLFIYQGETNYWKYQPLNPTSLYCST